MGEIIDLAAARCRRAAELQWIVDECRKAVEQTAPGTWQREVCEAELALAENAVAERALPAETV